MQDWKLGYLGRHTFPAEVTEFELRQTFSFDAEGRAEICRTFRPRLRTGVALQADDCEEAARNASFSRSGIAGHSLIAFRRKFPNTTGDPAPSGYAARCRAVSKNQVVKLPVFTHRVR